MVEYAPVEKSERTGAEMNAREDLVLTGWGYPEYVAAAAVALGALDGRAEVKGVSRRRLPELLSELATERGAQRCRRVYILGVSLTGDPAALAAAVKALRKKGVAVVWISAIEMPDEVAEAVGDSLEAHVIEGSLLEAVGRAFGVEVDRFRPFLKEPKCASAEVRDSLSMIAAAQFYYRNYQDESLYAKAHATV